jgi:heat shock protein HslJ
LWNWDSYMNSAGNLVSKLPDTEVTIQFKNGELLGDAGCNTYFGDYTINGTAITIGTLTMTLMYCTPEVK